MSSRHSQDFTSAIVPEFLQRLAEVVAPTNRRDAYFLGRPDTMWVLGKIVYWTPTLADGSIGIAQSALARLCSMSRGKLRPYLTLLADYGVIRVRSDYSARLKRHSVSNIKVLPELQAIFQAGRGGITPLARYCAKIASGELQPDESLWDVAPDGPNSDAAARLGSGGTQTASDPWKAARIDKEAALKDRVRRDGIEWRNKGQAFVTGCARIWTAAQVQYQGGTGQMPVWFGELSKLAKTNQHQQRELIRLFENEGGLRVAAAWYHYCTCIQKLDSQGKPVFDIKNPHRQWATIDKQPGTFAKYFNAITEDPATKSVLDSAPLREQLVVLYGDAIIASGPRYSKAERMAAAAARSPA